MTFEELQNQAEKDIKIDRTKLSTEALENPVTHAKYIRLLASTKSTLKKLENDLSRMNRQKHAFYNGKAENAFEIILDSANELKVYIEGDEDILTIKQKIANKKEQITYLEAICDIFRSRGFAIKNAIEIIKFEAGER